MKNPRACLVVFGTDYEEKYFVFPPTWSTEKRHYIELKKAATNFLRLEHDKRTELILIFKVKEWK